MAFSTSSMAKYPSSMPHVNTSSQHSIKRCRVLAIKCELEEPPKDKKLLSKSSKLGVGSPIVFIEAPRTIKTAASMPCLRVNTGLVKPGDVGRIVSRKPKDVWAVRLNIGTYLIDGKYFKALEFEE